MTSCRRETLVSRRLKAIPREWLFSLAEITSKYPQNRHDKSLAKALTEGQKGLFDDFYQKTFVRLLSAFVMPVF